MGMDTAQAIAGRLERAFAARGFAAPGVDALREAAGVTLRTLYRHFPSREAMVVAALRHRDERYRAFLDAGMPQGRGGLRHALARLGEWMREEAPPGCLFHQALVAHPDSAPIREEVARQKAATRDWLAALARREGVADAEGAFVLHEGLTQAAPHAGAEAATAATLAMLDRWLEERADG